MSDFSEGQKIGGYEILGILGKGGMGTVYKVNQTSMDRIVALKVLDPELVKKDQSFADRFIDEARAAGRLNHPNIIGVHDVSNAEVDDQTIYYFSMEIVEGENFKDVIERDGEIGLDVVQQVALKISDALIYAEQMNIVHRDIKPENIMITNDGLIKLADLGLALEIDGEEEATTGTKSEDGKVKVMGTPRYMSPEQCRGKAVDHRTDQYCLGGTLFHMLTGHPPYEGKSRKDLMRAQVLEPVPDPIEILDVPEAWRQLLMRMMAKRPEDRLADANTLKEAIRQAIAGQVYTPPRRGMRRHIPKSNNNVLLYLIIATMVLVTLGVILSNSGGTPTHHTPTPTPNPPSEDEASLEQARKLIARYSADENAQPQAIREAMRKLIELKDDLFSPSDAGYKLIEKELTQLEDFLTKQASGLEKELNRKLRQIGTEIVSGKFVEANKHLAEIPEHHRKMVQKEYDKCRADLNSEIEAKYKQISNQINSSNSTAAVDNYIKESKLKHVYPFRKAQLEKLANARKTVIKKEQAQNQQANAAAAKRQDKATWAKMIAELKRHRGTANFDRFIATANKSMDQLKDATLKSAAKAYGDFGRNAKDIDRRLHEHLERSKPSFLLDGKTSKNARCVGLDRENYVISLNSGRQTQRESRDHLGVPVASFLNGALGNRNAKQRSNLISVYLNYWKHPNAGQYPNTIPRLNKNYPHAEYPQLAAIKAPKPYEQPKYKVAFNNEALWAPQFQGPNFKFTKGELHWAVNKAIGGSPATDPESKLGFQTLAYKPAIKPNSKIEMKVNIKPNSFMMIGLRRGNSATRLVLNTRDVKLGAVTTGKDGKLKIVQLDGSSSRSVLGSGKDVRIEISIDSKSNILFDINGKNYTRYGGSSKEKFSLPGSGNTQLIFQGFKINPSADGKMEVIELEIEQ